MQESRRKEETKYRGKVKRGVIPALTFSDPHLRRLTSLVPIPDPPPGSWREISTEVRVRKVETM